jgi:Putative Flp pilus-assembly TadE/G-like
MKASFVRSRSGNVAILFALSLLVLAIAIGSAIDLGRAYNARQKLSEVAVLGCQYASRPSIVQITTEGSNGETNYVSNVDGFISASLNGQQFPYVQTVATPFSYSAAAPGNVTLATKVPTTFMNIIGVQNIPVSAFSNCPSPTSGGQNISGQYIIQEGFGNVPNDPCNASWCVIDQNGQGGDPSLYSPATSSSSFPSTPSYIGAEGIDWYITGYCLEIDLGGTTPTGAAAANPSKNAAELDCNSNGGPGPAGDSAITAKVYLSTGNYELRYDYQSRVDYPDYDPDYICGSTASDVSWANDTNSVGSPTPNALRNNQIGVYLDPVVGAAPPMHWTTDGTVELAGSDLIDVCVYGQNYWRERSVRLYVSTPGDYWLTFSADGQNNSYGGELDNIRLCTDTCPGTLNDNFPPSWAAGSTLFEDNFESPVYPSNLSLREGNIAESDGTSGTSASGWPSLAASGWAIAPINGVFYWTQGCPQGNQCLLLTYSTDNLLISRPFLLDPGYYQVSYDYESEMIFSNLSGAYCGSTPTAAGYPVLANVYGSGKLIVTNNGGPVTPEDSNTVGVFMSHAQLASTPNFITVPGQASTYTNPDGTTSTTPEVAPNGINLANYDPAQVDPLLDMCVYASSPQQRSVDVLIEKPAYYWLTFAAFGQAPVGGIIDDFKLTALGSPYMNSPPSNPVIIPTPSPQSSSPVAYPGYEIIADPLAPPAPLQ